MDSVHIKNIFQNASSLSIKSRVRRANGRSHRHFWPWSRSMNGSIFATTICDLCKVIPSVRVVYLTLPVLISGGELSAGALHPRDIRGTVLQRHFGAAVPVEKRMGGRQTEGGRQVHRQSGWSRRQGGRDERQGEVCRRPHAVAGTAHFQRG